MHSRETLSYAEVKGLQGHKSRCLGALLGCFAGDALGAPVEGWTWHHISGRGAVFGQVAHGRFTDDTQMTMALTQSLVRVGACDAADASKAYTEAFDANRGYGRSACNALSHLKAGIIDFQNSGRLDFPEGSFANGGAMRIAPVGLAYRHASSQTLRKAVEDALLCTHVHPEGIEGAFIQAAAIAAVSQSGVAQGGSTTATEPISSPAALLTHLQALAGLPAMQLKLQVLSDALPAAPQPQQGVPCIDGINWEGDADSQAWQYDCKVFEQAGVGAFQIGALDTAVCALWAVCRHWQDPKAAVIAAVRGGGDSDTIAAMAGALAGALHGANWIPEQWFDKLENGEDGRDACVALAVELSALNLT